MKKPDIAKRIARRAGVSPAEAADRLDRVVHEIVLRLKRGEKADLPGLGVLKQSPKGRLCFEPKDESRD